MPEIQDSEYCIDNWHLWVCLSPSFILKPLILLKRKYRIPNIVFTIGGYRVACLPAFLHSFILKPINLKCLKYHNFNLYASYPTGKEIQDSEYCIHNWRLLVCLSPSFILKPHILLKRKYRIPNIVFTIGVYGFACLQALCRDLSCLNAWNTGFRILYSQLASMGLLVSKLYVETYLV